jgi:hypothetical protein
VVPQECSPEATAGGLKPGARVILHRHRAVNGERNWVAEMGNFVGMTTNVTSIAGLDPTGCSTIRVGADGGRFHWRVRDVTIIGGGLGPGGGEAIPQRCGQERRFADFGLIQPGAEVLVWRHRPVDGQANWSPEMGGQLNEQVEVTELAGVDAQGCPVVRVDVDSGEWAWRVRDMSLVRPALPQGCGQRGQAESYGFLTAGATVRLSHHRPVGDQRNWRQQMEQFIGRVTTVSSIVPPDEQGCPVVRVAVDGGTNSWRVRDLTLLEPSAGLSRRVARQENEGRRDSRELTADIPQACGQTVGEENYGPIRVDTRVVLGRHRAVDGDPNWSPEMNDRVGQEATVRSLSGADAAGCPGVRVDVDDGEHFWRIRDMRLPEE